MTDNRSKTITLKDGRTLGYAEYGSPQDKPVFFFHGSPSSRLVGQITDEAARRLNARVIAIDRPGMGLSDFRPDRQILDWPDDVVQLADILGIGSFAVLGYSAGGAYAAACAFKIHQRLRAASIVSGLGPIDVRGATNDMPRQVRVFLLTARRAPFLLRLFLKQLMARRLPGDPGFSPTKALGSDADKAVLARPDVARVFGIALLEAFRSGNRGPARDAVLSACPWGFVPHDISTEVHVWHGEADILAPAVFGRYIANAIPNCRARFFPDEGHISLITNHKVTFP